MKYMVSDLMFVVIKVWYENGMICLIMSDKKEIRFPVELNKKLMNATDQQRSNIEINFLSTLTSTSTFFALCFKT